MLLIREGKFGHLGARRELRSLCCPWLLFPSLFWGKKGEIRGKRSRSGGILQKSAPSWGVWGVLRWFLGRKGAWVVKKYEYFQAQRWGKIGSLSAGENPPAPRRRSPWKKLKKNGEICSRWAGGCSCPRERCGKIKKKLKIKIKMRFFRLGKGRSHPKAENHPGNVNFAGQEELGAAGVLSLRARNQN